MDEKIIDDLNNELENILEQGRSVLRNAELEKKIQEIKTDTELYIRKYPLSSVAVSLFVGYFIGSIVRK